MTKTEGSQEFQVHIVGHFCENHEALIRIFQIEGSGLLATSTLVATFPDGEDRVIANDLQRYAYDMQGRDIPTRIIPGILGIDQLQEVLDREVMNHTREADEWIAKLALGNLAGMLLDSTGGLSGSYL